MSLAVVGVDSADPKTMGTQFLDNLQQRVEGVGLSNHLDDLSDLSEKDDSISDDLPSSLDFDSVVNNGPFKWLLSRLNRELQHRSNAESINKIGQHIESYVDTARSAENTPCQATFKVRFCLADFWNRQSVEDHMPKRLSKLISVTGSYEDAQALTCGQYLTQTWPVTGPQVLQHLDAVSMGGAREKHSGKSFPEHLRLLADLRCYRHSRRRNPDDELLDGFLTEGLFHGRCLRDKCVHPGSGRIAGLVGRDSSSIARSAPSRTRSPRDNDFRGSYGDC